MASARASSSPPTNNVPKVLKVIHLLHYVIGSVYTSTKLPKSVKVVWFCCNAIFLILVIIGNVGYVLTAEEMDALTAFILSWSVCGTTYIVVFYPLTTYLYHDEFKTLFDYIKKYPDLLTYTEELEDRSLEIYLKKVNPLSEFVYWITLEFCAMIPYWLCGPIDMLFLCENKYSFRDLYHHITSVPYMNRFPTVNIALMFYLLEFVLQCFGMVVAFSQVCLIMMIASQMNNNAVDICKDIRRINIETTSEGKCTFEKKFILLIKRYQELISITKVIRPYVEIFNTLTLIFIVVVLLCMSYPMFLTNFENALKLKQMFLVVSFSIYFYAQCNFGNKFNILNDAIIQQLCDIPWYRLQTKRRKLYYIFLVQVQRPIDFKALKVYPVDLTTFPRALKVTYSYVNVLNQAVNVSH